MTREDEDLLDLMVRIAETPAEWERIHKVLNQLGAEKETADDRPKPTTSTQSSRSESDNSTDYDNLPDKPSVSPPNRLVTDVITVNVTEEPTSTSLTTTEENQIKDYEKDQIPPTIKQDDTDTGWPDFDEAITKKIKKHFTSVEDNDVLDSDWFEDEWLDPVWNEFSAEPKEYHLPSPNLEQKYPFVSFKSNSQKEGNLKGPDPIKSTLLVNPQMLELPPQVSGQDNSTDGESSRSPRPVFLYHRVTTSPQERKGNSAFIAVSVVKQNPLEFPATTDSPVRVQNKIKSPWSHSRHIHRIQHQLESSLSEEPYRQHSHWGTQVRAHHNRGHRHHRSHTHGDSHH
ncbi:uncharacterized protein LOC124353210 [Homalodisca vitripennis]|uniref:uncharacterized protein LOC124353210 n=1 Tax=Homalodisca vitripennis TaxID=197043 RepID=UPI001EECF09C|nr:uncharacterized protein LOC124353210 [Homalodisca vitripennis]